MQQGLFLITMRDFVEISTTSAHRIVHTVSAAIARLKPNCVHFPIIREEIQREQLKFFNNARYPKVIGCINCIHIRIQFTYCPFGNSM